MNARFGYLKNGKFHLLYQGTLYEVDDFTMKKYQNKKDLLQKEDLSSDVKIVLYCSTKEGKTLYNRAGYALQSTVLYGNSKYKEVESMLAFIKENVNILRPVTRHLNERFLELANSYYADMPKFPSSMDQFLMKLDKEAKENDHYQALLSGPYYYFIKQASLAYLKDEKQIKEIITEEKPKDRVSIQIKPGNLTIHGDGIHEFLEECHLNNDQEEFWNLASLDDVVISIQKNKEYKKNPNH